ncbi:MAG: heavy-metal-associated domain-containing protein [Lachnospiraceae bacterium]|nr:heavy-metal-associated domain-containing protein [Lachnospiraceae bacterium]
MKPQDLIIVAVLLIILIPAIKSTITHMKGEGSCCGGPKEKVPKKKIKGTPKKVYTVIIEGMHCDNCKNRVEKHLNEIEGVVGKVKLSRNTAKVYVYDDTPESLIKETIENLDFKVTKISE